MAEQEVGQLLGTLTAALEAARPGQADAVDALTMLLALTVGVSRGMSQEEAVCLAADIEFTVEKFVVAKSELGVSNGAEM